jgi:hypothetical protein
MTFFEASERISHAKAAKISAEERIRLRAPLPSGASGLAMVT